MMYDLGNLTKEYESKKETLEKDLNHQYDPLTNERMTNKLSMKYKKICQKNGYDPDEDEKEKKKQNTRTVQATMSYPRKMCHMLR